jgi:predicted PurR-regulated permease PerM
MNGRSGIKTVVVGLSLALLLYIGYVIRAAVLLIVVSVILSVIFTPLVNKIRHIRLWGWSPSQGFAILILFALALSALGIFFAFAVPPITRDTQQLTQDLPKNLESFQQKLRHLPFGGTIASRLNEPGIRRWIDAGLQTAFGFLPGFMSGVMALLTLVLLIAYFMLDGDRAFQWAMSLLPVSARDRLAHTLQQGASRMQRWLYGQLALMVILGSLSFLVFGLLGVRYFYALAIFAGVANFVPILGPIATVIVAGAVAALDSWTKVLGVLIFYVVYQQVENAYLTPKIMRSAVDLPGVAVVVALTIGGELAGLLGAIVAVPTAALLATVVNEYLGPRSREYKREERRAA